LIESSDVAALRITKGVTVWIGVATAQQAAV